MPKGYQSVAKIIDKAFSQSDNFHVGMNNLEIEITWLEGKNLEIIPLPNIKGRQGFKLKIS